MSSYPRSELKTDEKNILPRSSLESLCIAVAVVVTYRVRTLTVSCISETSTPTGETAQDRHSWASSGLALTQSLILSHGNFRELEKFKGLQAGQAQSGAFCQGDV